MSEQFEVKLYCKLLMCSYLYYWHSLCLGLRMKILLTYIGICCFCVSVQAQEGKSISLAECVEYALRHNPKLKKNRILERQSQINYSESWQDLLPSLSGNLSHNFSQGRTIDPTTNLFVDLNQSSGNPDLSSSVVLFDGLAMLYRIREQAKSWKASQLMVESEIDQLKLDVLLAYMQVLTAADVLSQQELNVSTTEAQVKRLEIMHQEGAVSPADYFDMKGQLAAEKQQTQNLIKNLFDSRLALARLMHLPINELGTLKPFYGHAEKLEEHLNLFEVAQQAMPAYQALAYTKAAAADGIKRARAAYLPRLSFGAGIQSRYSSADERAYGRQIQNNLGKYMGFNLAIPIFSKFQIRNNVKRAKWRYEEQVFEEELQLDLLREQTEKAVFDLRQAYTEMQYIREQVQSFEESFRIAEIRFQLGDINSLNFLIAKNKFEQAQFALIMAEKQLLLKQYTIRYYQGHFAI